MKDINSLKGTKVLLRKPNEQDIYDYLGCDTSIELIRMLGGDYRSAQPKTLESAVLFVDKIRNSQFRWCIEYKGRFIGKTGLTINNKDNRARYSINIFDSNCWGKRLGTEVTELILRYAFFDLKLHRVDLRVLEYNHRAINCYKNCGFTIEGMEREGAFIEGNYETDIIMSILDREYYELFEDSRKA